MPAVPSSHLHPDALKTRFEHPPDWQPEVEREVQFSNRQPAQAAVLIPIVMRGNDVPEPTVLLTRRAVHMSTHSGQVAFPGGKVDPEDASIHATALREAHEEVGLHARHVQIIGQLPVYVTGTAFWVTPVVGLVSPELELRPNRDGVDDVFEVPPSFLLNTAHQRREHFGCQGAKRQWCSMPSQEHRKMPNGDIQAIEHFIWGATAAMLRNFYRFLVVNPAR